MSATCNLWAEAPKVDAYDHTIVGVAHRECDGTQGAVEVTVRIRVDRKFWWDKTLVTKTVTTAEQTISVIYQCTGRGSQVVFTEIIVRGKKAKSPRVGASLCS